MMVKAELFLVSIRSTILIVTLYPVRWLCEQAIALYPFDIGDKTVSTLKDNASATRINLVCILRTNLEANDENFVISSDIRHKVFGPRVRSFGAAVSSRCTLFSEAGNGWKMGRNGQSITPQNVRNALTCGLPREFKLEYSVGVFEIVLVTIGYGSVYQSVTFFCSKFLPFLLCSCVTYYFVINISLF